MHEELKRKAAFWFFQYRRHAVTAAGLAECGDHERAEGHHRAAMEMLDWYFDLIDKIARVGDDATAEDA